jgi:ubiquinone biosynthesis protein UbiJ
MLLAASTLNHILAQNAWATQRLAPLAGKTFAVQAAPLPALGFTIQADGTLHSALPGAPPETTLSATPDALLRYFTVKPHDPSLIHIAGDRELGAEIGHVLAHISWEAEEDLSRVFGDVIAHRLTGFARNWFEWRKQAALSFVTAASEYFTEERPLIASRNGLAQFARDVDAVRSATELLEVRIQKLVNHE